MRDWICFQIGARDHYLVPRALHKPGRLGALFTDYWSRASPAASNLARLSRGAERVHPELGDAQVVDFPFRAVAFEVATRLQRKHGWDLMRRRNSWFQKHAAARMASLSGNPEARAWRTVFAYSYAARDIFAAARDLGLKTVLGQIDGGPFDEEIIHAAHSRRPEWVAGWRRAPPEYWDEWRLEIAQADHIVVNSEWSKHCLTSAGIDPASIRIVPLAYEPQSRLDSRSAYPSVFSRNRPLRVLFLGQVSLRKGVAELLEAVELLGNAPVEVTLAGPVGIRIPERFLNHPRLRWLGPVRRGEAPNVYLDADVFILPTLSDGFAITQLEARAYGLPLIVSRNCGSVVKPGENGWLLDEVSGEAIASAIDRLLRQPHLLAHASSSKQDGSSTVAQFGSRMTALTDADPGASA